MTIYAIGRQLAIKLLERFKNDNLVTLESFSQSGVDEMGELEEAWTNVRDIECAVVPQDGKSDSSVMIKS